MHQHAQVYTAVYGGPPPVNTVAALFEKLCYENKDQLSAGIIVAGWDAENGGTVYNVPLGGGMFQQPWAIGGESVGGLGSATSNSRFQVLDRRTSMVIVTRRTRRVGEKRRR